MEAIESLLDANVRSPSYYVARATVRCWHCGLSTGLVGLAMPDSHETLDADADADIWVRADFTAFLFYVEQLPADVQRQLAGLSRSFRLAYSAATATCYWANHCEHCGKLLGDHELHCEPDGAFAPSSEGAAADIQLLHILEPFAALAAGYAFEPEFFRFMSKS